MFVPHTRLITPVTFILFAWCLCCSSGCWPSPPERNTDTGLRHEESGEPGKSAAVDQRPTNLPSPKPSIQSVERAQPTAKKIPRVTLRGRFVFGGPPPAPRLIETNLAFCGKDKMEDESLLVDPYNRGVANVCIWLDSDAPPERPDLRRTPVTIYNENCQFVPHIAILRVNQTLRIQNADPVGHILKIDGFRNDPVVANLPVKNTAEATFSAAERVPSIMTSSVYPWMRGYLIVKDHGFVATSQRDGTFEIRDLPAAKLRFQVWHEKVGYVRRVTRDDSEAEWQRGRFDLELPHDVDLGDIIIPADLFAT